MNRLALVIKSLEEAGLTESASSLRSIDKLYKVAAVDFSKEIEILQQLTSIVSSLQGKPLKHIVRDSMTFPPYSLETSDKYIVYSGESLTNYSKQEILSIGFSNFLNNFAEKYMSNHLNTLAGTDYRRYSQATEALKELAKEVKDNYQKILKSRTPKELERLKIQHITKQDLATSLRRINTSLENLNLFHTVIAEKYVLVLANQGGYMQLGSEFVPDPEFHGPVGDESPPIKKTDEQKSKEEALLSDEDVGDLDWSDFAKKPNHLSLKAIEMKLEQMEDEGLTDTKEYRELNEEANRLARIDDPALKKSTLKLSQVENTPLTLLQRLKNLTYDFDQIRVRIDSKYSKLLNMSIQEFRKKTDIDTLLKIKSKASSSLSQRFAAPKKKKDMFEGFKERSKEYEISSQYLQLESAKRVAKAVLSGTIGYMKKQKEKDTFVLFSPNQILGAWAYLENDLSIKYESLIRSIVSRIVQDPEVDESAKVKLDTELQATYSETIDHKTSRELMKIINTLRS